MPHLIELGTIALLLGACVPKTLPSSLHYRHIVLSAEPVEQPLLAGPPETAGMRSGRVVLKAGEAMHRHSTKGNEELLVFLTGKARVVVGDESVPLAAGEVLYIPPQTEHEVHNDGSEELRYIYAVAPASR
jgi:mannose-6-phosphate isomerase-like protein (cupin superfamily)